MKNKIILKRFPACRIQDGVGSPNERILQTRMLWSNILFNVWMKTRMAGSIRGKTHFSEDSGNGVKSVNGSEIMNIAKQRLKCMPVT